MRLRKETMSFVTGHNFTPNRSGYTSSTKGTQAESGGKYPKLRLENVPLRSVEFKCSSGGSWSRRVEKSMVVLRV